MIFGARSLNDNGTFLGLNIYDLIGSVAVLVITSELLSPIKLEFLSIAFGILALVSLIPIRLKYRRRIIRDHIGFYLCARKITCVGSNKNAHRR